MIELTKYKQDKSIWINPNLIESMEAEVIRDGNGNTKSNYVDIHMVSGRAYRVEDTIKQINEYVMEAGGWERVW